MDKISWFHFQRSLPDPPGTAKSTTGPTLTIACSDARPTLRALENGHQATGNSPQRRLRSVNARSPSPDSSLATVRSARVGHVASGNAAVLQVTSTTVPRSAEKVSVSQPYIFMVPADSPWTRTLTGRAMHPQCLLL